MSCFNFDINDTCEITEPEVLYFEVAMVDNSIGGYLFGLLSYQLLNFEDEIFLENDDNYCVTIDNNEDIVMLDIDDGYCVEIDSLKDNLVMLETNDSYCVKIDSSEENLVILEIDNGYM